MIGKVIGNYHITNELARGGMGAVYLGRHVTLPRDVVVKSILIPACQPELEKHLKARFLREAYIQSQFDHPNIVRVYEFFIASENYYLVMEYIAGINLGDLIDGQGPLALPQALHIFGQALAAMDYAHNFNYIDESGYSRTGVIHRDIKPGNMLVDGHGRLKITDFGIVKLIGEQRLTQIGFNPGTVEYMSPEQLCGAELDARSDIYSLGVTLYAILTGRLPFTISSSGSDYGVRKGHMELDPPPIAKLRPDLPPDLVTIVTRSLKKDPQERFQTVAEFRDAIHYVERTTGHGSMRGIGSEIVEAQSSSAVATLIDPSQQVLSGATIPKSYPAPSESKGSAIRDELRTESQIGRESMQSPRLGRRLFLTGAGLFLLFFAVLSIVSIYLWRRSSPVSKPMPSDPNSPNQSHTRQPFFEDQYLRVTVLSLTKRGNTIEAVVSYQNRLPDEFRITGAQIYLLDEKGDRWNYRDDTANFNSSVTLAPNTKLTTRFHFDTQSAVEGRVFTFVYSFIAGYRGERTAIVNDISIQ